ncbi:MAG: aminotransferase class I/II-fold pyridoxal phosphate-dependent enzyme [Bifidobacteriaceae bacterium]|jgi:aminotransferase|nr:aminotransferase class I/II-fold pyridoxal phosphate-dependent enzyme [Bifidobacteriaceae bacterium]
MSEFKGGLEGKLSRRLLPMLPNKARAFDLMASEIPDIVKLTLGEPDFPVPDDVKNTMLAGITADDSHYYQSKGKPELLRAAANFFDKRCGLKYDPGSEILITVGATGSLFAVLSTLLNPGDKVILPSPMFALYESDIIFNQGVPIFVDTTDDGYVLTPEKLQSVINENPDAKAILLNYPSNPTGMTYSDAQIRALADVLAKTDIAVISDEIYSELVYDGAHVSIAKYLKDQTIVINGVSKSHAMTGYRLGVIAAPADLIAKLTIVHALTATVASNPSMNGAIQAWATDEGAEDVKPMLLEYRKRRDYLYEKLCELGFKIVKPNGAFYIFAKIPYDLEQDAVKFTKDLAYEAKVAILPGDIFGVGGEHHVRLSYAASMKNLQTAVQRITDYITAKRNDAHK